MGENGVPSGVVQSRHIPHYSPIRKSFSTRKTHGSSSRPYPDNVRQDSNYGPPVRYQCDEPLGWEKTRSLRGWYRAATYHIGGPSFQSAWYPELHLISCSFSARVRRMTCMPHLGSSSNGRKFCAHAGAKHSQSASFRPDNLTVHSSRGTRCCGFWLNISGVYVQQWSLLGAARAAPARTESHVHTWPHTAVSAMHGLLRNGTM